jgi:hypothetical protein
MRAIADPALPTCVELRTPDEAGPPTSATSQAIWRGPRAARARAVVLLTTLLTALLGCGTAPPRAAFDLAIDPTERNDLSTARPEQLARLQGLLESHHAGMPAPAWRSFLELPISIDKTLDQPEAADDEHSYWFN